MTLSELQQFLQIKISETSSQAWQDFENLMIVASHCFGKKDEAKRVESADELEMMLRSMGGG